MEGYHCYLACTKCFTDFFLQFSFYSLPSAHFPLLTHQVSLGSAQKNKPILSLGFYSLVRAHNLAVQPITVPLFMSPYQAQLNIIVVPSLLSF